MQTTERASALGRRSRAWHKLGGLRSKLIEEHFLVMAVPSALEDLARIVAPLEAQELSHLRVALLDLLSTRPSVVGEVVAAAELDGTVDKAPEVVGRLA